MTPSLSVVIPTYGRDQVLVDTCNHLLQLEPTAKEIVLVDQSETHEPETRSTLEGWDKDGRIRWLRLDRPSIARAMNTGLLQASGDVVLFLDDDIVPESDLFAAHIRAHSRSGAEVVAGRVIQPWDRPGEVGQLSRCGEFNFTSMEGRYIDQFMGGNVSMRRDCALAVGGVDENFVRVAYRFERELADRLVSKGYRIWYEPSASIKHLKVDSGGTRAYGQRWLNPGHGVGEYYYLLRSGRVRRKSYAIAKRMYGSMANRYHARRPWMLPMTLGVELVAMGWATAKCLRGPKLIETGREVPV